MDRELGRIGATALLLLLGASGGGVPVAIAQTQGSGFWKAQPAETAPETKTPEGNATPAQPIAAAFPVPPAEAEAAIAAAKAKLERKLKDPASAQYRDIKAIRNGDKVIVCGEYNAKNSYGGYGGFEKFTVSADSVLTEMTDARINAIYLKFWQKLCGPTP